jgi:hypothetical protein
VYNRKPNQNFLDGRVSAIIVALPVLIPVFLMILGVFSLLLLLVGNLNVPLSLFLTMVLFSLFVPSLIMESRSAVSKELVICTILVLVGSMMWGLVNYRYASENVFVDRDPAAYAVTAAIVVEQSGASIVPNLDFVAINDISSNSPGFVDSGKANGEIQGHGQKFYPVLLGVIGKLVGPEAVVRMNVLFGAAAMLAFFGFASRLLRPYWAGLATALLSLTLPFIYFSRDTYTEPMTLMLVFSGLTVLWMAQKSTNTLLWVLAGLVFGASLLVRIDSYLIVSGVLVGLFSQKLFLSNSVTKRWLRDFSLMLAGILGLALASIFELISLSLPYYRGHSGLLKMQIIAIGLMLVLGFIALFIKARYGLFNRINLSPASKLVAVITIILFSFILLLISRPLWYTPGAENLNSLVASLQAAEGDMSSEPRNYAELTMFWVYWYLGGLVSFLSAAGLVVFLYTVRNKDIKYLMVFMLAFLSTAVLYFNLPKITPDQIWAVRRFLPIIFPSLILFAFSLVNYLDSKYIQRFPFPKIAIFLVSVALLASPLYTAHRYVRHADSRQLTFLKDTCDAIPEDSVVLWLGDTRQLSVSAYLYCDIESIGYRGLYAVDNLPNEDTLAEIAQVAEDYGLTPFVALFDSQKVDILYDDRQLDNFQKVSTGEYKLMQRTLTAPPRGIMTIRDSILLGQIELDGTVTRITEVEALIEQ